MHKSALILIAGGAVGLALSLVMGWLGFPHIIRHYIRKNAAKLEPESQLYEIWSESKIPIYIKFYFFNVTNPEEIEQGGKPTVTEIGPYTYLKTKTRDGIEPGTELNGTLQYTQQIWFHFLPGSSLGTEQDLITFVNIPFVGLAKAVTKIIPESKVHETINDKLTQSGEKLFKTASMKELLFDGISLNNYIELLKSFNGNVKIPKSFESGKFGLYYGKNGSEETYEIDAGLTNLKLLGTIYKWNNLTTLPFWKSDECNTIKGTDGTIYPPATITKTTKLATFSAEICRSITIEFDKLVEFKGLFPLYRFTTSKEISQGIKSNSKNICYCYETNIKPELCERDGFLMMAGCLGGENSAIVMSSPHFYGTTEASLIEGIGGLNPNEDKHKTAIDIEPYTAMILRAAKRLQMNVDIQQYESMGTFSKVKSMAFPIMWVEETAEVSEENLGTIKIIYSILGIIDIGKYVAVGISGLFLGFGVLIGMLRQDEDDIQVQKLVK